MGQETKLCPVWFVVVDAHGKPYKGICADRAMMALNSNITDFRDEAFLKNSSAFSGCCTASQLKVFRSNTAFGAHETHLKSSLVLNGLGSTEDDALVVVVPSTTSSSPSSAASSQSEKAQSRK
jgi:hypothetical protein